MLQKKNRETKYPRRLLTLKVASALLATASCISCCTTKAVAQFPTVKKETMDSILLDAAYQQAGITLPNTPFHPDSLEDIIAELSFSKKPEYIGEMKTPLAQSNKYEPLPSTLLDPSISEYLYRFRPG